MASSGPVVLHIWLRRYRIVNLARLRDRPVGPRAHLYRTSPNIEVLIPLLRRGEARRCLRSQQPS